MKSRLAIIAAVGLAAGSARANPHVEIASAADEDDPFDLYVTVDYNSTLRRSAIKRELVGYPGTDPDGGVPLVKDLVFESLRHEIVPRLEIGVFTDIAVYGALPVVVVDERTLELDQRSEPCVFPGSGSAPTCTDRTNSTTIQDGLLPPTGFDAADPTGPGFTRDADPTIFRGVDRTGLDQLHLGIAWAPMNQRRDPTKPTWKLGAEVRIAVGAPARLSRADPDSENGVGRGVHEVKLWTTMAKRTSWAIPYFETWWMAAFSTTDTSQFRDPPQGQFGAERISPQQRAGSRFGFEALTWQGDTREQHVGLDLSTGVEAHFEGRGYSEMWEVFAYAGDAASDGPLVLQADPTSGGPDFSHPGVSNVENYLTLSARIALNASIGPRVQFSAAFEYGWDQSHLISFADAGVDRPTCSGGESGGCEVDDNDVVNPATVEVNPLHAPTIDGAGHRYRVDESHAFIAAIRAMFLF